MKTSRVPAQITTVEDKIAGNLSVQQMALLIMPFFFGFLTFIIFPPNLQFVLYKFVVVAVLFILFGLLAVRVKGRLLLSWAIVFVSYNTRPQYYVFDKNDAFLRDVTSPKTSRQKKQIPSEKPENEERAIAPQLSTAEVVRLEEVMTNPQAKLRFQAGKKGELNVYITEIK